MTSAAVWRSWRLDAVRRGPAGPELELGLLGLGLTAQGDNGFTAQLMSLRELERCYVASPAAGGSDQAKKSCSS